MALQATVKNAAGTGFVVTNAVRTVAGALVSVSKYVKDVAGTQYLIFVDPAFTTNTPSSRTCINAATDRTCINSATDRTCINPAKNRTLST